MAKKRKNIKRQQQAKADRSEEKRAAVLNSGSRSRTPMIIGFLAAALIASGGIYIMGGKSQGKSAAQNTASARSSSGIQSSSKQISFPTNIFEDGRARYFKYDSPDGLSIRYFILKSSDGIIRAAFDACDVCWRERKGYHQEGDVMVCNNCGQRFPSVKVNEIRGGCNPSPLKRKLTGNKVIIKVADILEGGNLYFNFGPRGRRSQT